jgi:hypothetical protein
MNSIATRYAPPLSRSTLIPRELVHRTSLAEVLLSDVQQVGEHTYRAAAQWSRSHPTFDRAGDGRHDPLMVAETLRQLGLCVPLRHYGVPPDSHFLIEELRFEIDPAAEPRAGFAGSEITCEVEVDELQSSRRGPLQRLHVTVRCLVDGREFARAEGVPRFLNPCAYAAVRSRKPADDPAEHALPVPPEPSQVGVQLAGDVLIGLDAKGGIRLAPVDPYHPFFFDHFSDHIPGMVLIEAVRQAAALRMQVPRLRIAACILQAAHFTEPSPPARIACDVVGRVAEFEIRQLGRQTATGSLRFE